MTDEIITKTFSRNLNRFMEEFDMNQSDLARRLGVSRTQVSFWCAGKNVPRTNCLTEMCEIFHCSLGELLTDGVSSPGSTSRCRTDEEEELLQIFRSCSARGRMRIIQAALNAKDESHEK